jgi:hypothetical protein
MEMKQQSVHDALALMDRIIMAEHGLDCKRSDGLPADHVYATVLENAIIVLEAYGWTYVGD